MFKDTDQELARLEAELLKEEEPVMEAEQPDADDFEEAEEELLPPPEYFYEDTRAADGPAVYQNYSNDYGKNLRNYASGYRAYNSDESDEDLEAFSEDVYETEPERRSSGLLITACVLAVAVAAVALYLVLWYWGVL